MNKNSKSEKSKSEKSGSEKLETRNSESIKGLETFFSHDLRNSFNEIAKIVSLAFHYSFDGFCVTRGDGVMVAINNAAAGYLNLSPKALLGRNVTDVMAEKYYDVSTGMEVIKKRKKLTRIYRTFDNKSILNTSIPIFDEQGNIRYVVQNERDITKIKRLENQLKKEQAIKKELIQEIRQLSIESEGHDQIIANSLKMRQILTLTTRCASIDLDSLLLLGETGVGKGLLTNFFHNVSDRSEKPLIRVNFAALPENLLEAELFGYEPGAFTGAGKTPKPGLFELAEGGTLFLDEVGELPLSIQAKLLNCLEERKIFRLGGTRFRQINCCIVAATNRDLKQMCASKLFREDLYYRLNTVRIKVPCLRERKEDISPLAKHFLSRYNKKYKMNKTISPQGYRKLTRYGFPGNVRELSNMINNAMIMSESQDIIDHIILEPRSLPKGKENTEPGVLLRGHNTLGRQMESFEKNIIKNTLAHYSTGLEAARGLGISKATMMRKLKKYQLLKKDRI